MKKVILLIEAVSSYGRGLLKGISEYSRLYGPWYFYREALTPFYRTRMKEFDFSRLKNIKADGIVTRVFGETEKIASLDLPTIATDDDKNITKFPGIISDYEAAGRMAADHLLSLGFENFAYCTYGDYFWSKKRGEFFSKRLQEEGHKTYFYESLTRKNNYFEDEQESIQKWLKEIPKPVGVMAANDDMGLQVLEACRAANFYVPEEVAVVGVDNDELLCGLSTPPLTSVAIDTYRAGFEAARLLDEMMTERKTKKNMVVARATHIEVRQSTDILITEDSVVIEAVRYIKANLNKPIQVSDVAEHVNVSRRTLLEKFRNNLGRTVHEELKRLRIEKISQMLLKTDTPIFQIAHDLNFTNVEHIARYFKTEKGMTPLAYRKKYGSGFLRDSMDYLEKSENEPTEN